MKNQQPFKFLSRGKLFAEVKLHDLDTGKERTVSHEDECRDDTERSAYQECVSQASVISMGKTIAEPIA